MDIALAWNADAGQADMAMAGGDLALDAGLRTAVLVSLFTDAPAQPGDAIPDGSADRRGWWGDLPAAPELQGRAADATGSRLWLLDRALQTDATLALAKAYAEEALAWMVADRVAGSVSATASYPQPGRLRLDIVIAQEGAASTHAVEWSFS